MITDPNIYFREGCGRCDRFQTPDCSTQLWADGLAALRAICRGLDLTETAKWGHPCYMHADRNIAIFGAFRTDFRLSFMNAGLLSDPDGHLQPAGPNTDLPSVLRFTSLDDVTALTAVITDFLTQLKDHADKGTKPPKRDHGDLDLPDELTTAFDADPDYAAAFDDLTPGRQRGWALHFNAAKQPATRDRRIAKARAAVMAGKGWNER